MEEGGVRQVNYPWSIRSRIRFSTVWKTRGRRWKRKNFETRPGEIASVSCAIFEPRTTGNGND